jgi:PAS domain S-box-containing protein
MDQEARRKCSILIVEDEPIVAKDLQQSLREMHYDAFGIASSADDAIQRASERCPDLVLMDIRIKGVLDGIQTAEILRQRFGVSVIYLTAHADEATIERASKTLPYAYLLKPIKSAELRSAIEVALFRQRLDQNVRERERWFSTALRSVSDAVVTVDLGGTITYLNPAAEALIGATAEAAVGKTAEQVLQLMGHTSAPGAGGPLAEALRSHLPTQPDQGKLRNIETGEQHSISDYAAPILQDGKMLGAVMVFRDVGEKQIMQKQLELADRVASLGTMAAGTAHELNNPLAVVVTNAGFLDEELVQLHADLKSSVLHEVTKDRFTRIFAAVRDVQSSASRMARIVRDLRTFARPAENESQHVDLAGCIEWAVRATAHEFQHRAQLSTRLGHAPSVAGDSGRIEQVLVNLLVNAAHAITPGHAERNEVCVTLRMDASGRAVIDISDTGNGIRPEVMQKMFTPFFTTKPAGSGTGLGLSICQGIVKSMGGEISVTSELGSGTTFSVTMPPGPGSATVPPVESAAEFTMARGRVLVIDDETALLRAMHRILEDENHTVTATESAIDALAMIARGDRFDVILSDLMMPSMTGVEFYHALLARDPALAACVVFVSGGAVTSRVDSFLKAVPNLRLDKPFKAAQLRDITQMVLARRHSAGLSPVRS